MRARGWFVLFALAAPLLAQTAWAAKTGFEDRRFQLTPFGGWVLYNDKLTYASGQKFKDAAYIGGRAAVRLGSIVWLEAAGGTSSTKPDVGGDDVTWTHVSGNLLFSPSTGHALSPFVSLGGGAWSISHAKAADQHSSAFEVAGGVRLRLSSVVGLRLEARNALEVPKGNFEAASVNNIIFGAGLSFGFGGKARDADRDGVADKSDKCPDTPFGCIVDAVGCQTDADGDGVCDGIDSCPATPAGAKVDAHGCPIDSDGDGVFDGIDQCPNTTTGCKVDANGCPTDSDGDGVCDGLDQCANTTSGCKVDLNGCPVDSDGDGVCDGLDKCPNTGAGLRVDKDGCPIEIMERETELLDTGMIRISDINFASAKADVPEEAAATLDVVGAVLSKWPEIKIEIGGHTDSRGSAAYNLTLSQGRAAAVRDYLLAHFSQLQPDQITVKGYGESKPLVANTNALNLAKNRRVECKVLNKRELKRQVEKRRLLNK